MKTFIQNGDVLTVPAPTGGVTSGDGVLIGSLFGVAAFTTAEGESAELATTGVYELPKDSTAANALGDRASWGDAAKQIKLPAVGLYPVGIATETARAGISTIKVRLNGASQWQHDAVRLALSQNSPAVRPPGLVSGHAPQPRAAGSAPPA